jgi:hypothetical protein
MTEFGQHCSSGRGTFLNSEFKLLSNQKQQLFLSGINLGKQCAYQEVAFTYPARSVQVTESTVDWERK